MDLTFWKKKLKEAERELDAATKLSDVNWAAQKLTGAKKALKRLEGRAMAGRLAGPGP